MSNFWRESVIQLLTIRWIDVIDCRQGIALKNKSNVLKITKENVLRQSLIGKLERKIGLSDMSGSYRPFLNSKIH